MTVYVVASSPVLLDTETVSSAGDAEADADGLVVALVGAALVGAALVGVGLEVGLEVGLDCEVAACVAVAVGPDDLAGCFGSDRAPLRGSVEVVSSGFVETRELGPAVFRAGVAGLGVENEGAGMDVRWAEGDAEPGVIAPAEEPESGSPACAGVGVLSSRTAAGRCPVGDAEFSEGDDGDVSAGN